MAAGDATEGERMASEFIRCPGCGLFVSTRRSALCPRCARPVPGSTAVASTAPAVGPARPAPAPASRSSVTAAPAPARNDLSRLSPLGIVGSATDLPEQAARALWLHLALRGLALAGLALGYAGMRRARTGAAREALAQTFE